ALDARSDRAVIYILERRKLISCRSAIPTRRRRGGGRSRGSFSFAGMQQSAEGADKLQVVVIGGTELDAIALVNVTRGHSLWAKRFFGASLLGFDCGLDTHVRSANLDKTIDR